MILSFAKISDIDGVLSLQYKYQNNSIADKDKIDGFVTTSFTKDELKSLIIDEKGLFIAKDKGQIIAYVMAASWNYWSSWSMFEYMIKYLPNVDYLGEKLNTNNTFQYGPVCIDKGFRGNGTLEKIPNTNYIYKQK